MPVERSAGAVIYRMTKQGREYLLIQHQDQKDSRSSKPVPGHWDFPKGHIEKGERTEETAQREVAEETGINRILFMPGFKETIRYFVVYEGARRLKFVAFFLARAGPRARVKISWEHRDFAWLPYREAHERLTYGGAKEVLEKAERFLRLQKRTPS